MDMIQLQHGLQLSVLWLLAGLLVTNLNGITATPLPMINALQRQSFDHQLTKSALLTKSSLLLDDTNRQGEEVAENQRIQCYRHHEFAIFVSPDEVDNVRLHGGSRSDRLYTFVNQNGHSKYYFCHPCSECGEGVRILAQCRIRQDILCSNVCLNSTWVYDEYLRRCYPDQQTESVWFTTVAASKSAASTTTLYQRITSTSEQLTQSIRFILGDDGDSGINDAEKDPDEKDEMGDEISIWRKEIIPISVGVLTLNIMFAILLVWKKRDSIRKKMAFRSTPQLQRDSYTPNNVSQSSYRPATAEHDEWNRPDQVIDITSPVVTVVNPDASTNRLKENNLNRFAHNCQPAVSSQTIQSTVQPLISALPEVTVKPGTKPYWIEMSAYISPQGGQLSCDESDVIVEIPPGAVPSRQLIIVRVSRTPSITDGLKDGELFLSPLVDCQCPGLKRFNKDVLIKLPHRAHLGPSWQFTVHYTDDSSTDQSPLDSSWNRVKSSCIDASRDVSKSRPAASASRSDVQFTIDGKYVYITTPHFSKYTCSGCGKKRELSLEAVVYIVDNLKNRRLDLHCYLIDSIKDFQEKININERYRLHTEHKPLIVNAKKEKDLEVSLMGVREDWPWIADQSFHKTTQIVKLDEIIRCHSDTSPVFVTFTLRPKIQQQPGNPAETSNTFLEAAVYIRQKSKEQGVTLDVALDLDFGKQTQLKGGNVQDMFEPLSKKIRANEWRPLYRSLMKTSSSCSINIDADINCLEYKAPNDLKEQIYQGFMKWLSAMGKKATVTRLCESLREVGLVATAEDIENGRMYDKMHVQDEKSPERMGDVVISYDNTESHV